MRLLLDPGHGGLQLGHSASDHHEKDFTLDLARRVASALGSGVYLTRNSDQDISHGQRSRMVQEHDLTVSLHFHAVGNPFMHRLEGGARVEEGEALARFLLEKVKHAVGEPYWYRPTQTRITGGTRKPVCVLMLGYLSHPETLAGLVSGERLDATAEALAQGLMQHVGQPS